MLDEESATLCNQQRAAEDCECAGKAGSVDKHTLEGSKAEEMMM
jgi:hypothetical protein